MPIAQQGVDILGADSSESMLAAARFNGPISLHMEYEAADERAAIARDFAFLRKQVDVAYGGLS